MAVVDRKVAMVDQLLKVLDAEAVHPRLCQKVYRMDFFVPRSVAAALFRDVPDNLHTAAPHLGCRSLLPSEKADLEVVLHRHLPDSC